LNWVSGEQ